MATVTVPAGAGGDVTSMVTVAGSEPASDSVTECHGRRRERRRRAAAPPAGRRCCRGPGVALRPQGPGATLRQGAT